ncbi:YpoC family protein [Staphylococcus debuckii]|uniref:YpoC family protein n=1 Tax=Staphylococcus debuckii TaxID=2044912 RepID=A0ABU9EZ73_9STAP|nr:hypothetical protein [Staphylococcus debuckii]AYU55256.1 hypothetical protein CNQ82_07265 [Staphylococcus debuckii]
MITKADFEEKEVILDQIAKNKKLTSPEGKSQLDDYLDLIQNYFCQINNISVINFEEIENYPIVPINFKERFDYIQERRHHFMGYRQMKTLVSELIKMNAAYKVRQSHRKQ